MQPKIPLVYIAGPFRARTYWQIEQNVHRVKEVGAEIAPLGCYPVMPHANTFSFHGLGTDEFWLGATLEMMRRCDAVIFIKGFTRSKGAVAEHQEVIRRSMPHFYWERKGDREEFTKWVLAVRYPEVAHA